MIELISVYRVPEAVEILFNLLKERTPKQSISHKHMPTPEEHFRFFMSKPYTAWYLIKGDDNYVGSIYLTDNREIGVFIFERYARLGYGLGAVKELMHLWPGRFLANINPSNDTSIKFFTKNFRARHIQNTYELQPTEEISNAKSTEGDG